LTVKSAKALQEIRDSTRKIFFISMGLAQLLDFDYINLTDWALFSEKALMCL
jgi:hypothetical protein